MGIDNIAGGEIQMQQLVTALLSPMAFAIGFLWPLATQTLLALEVMTVGWQALLLGAVIALPLGAIAQVRGSWLWIR